MFDIIMEHFNVILLRGHFMYWRLGLNSFKCSRSECIVFRITNNHWRKKSDKPKYKIKSAQSKIKKKQIFQDKK